mmetsp:Transcript_10611/g.19379  ORF Transcript_10611/g.19379 Transcript_10611/m.19379 type:complete len:179 (+) Transcript_10611:68-604(+)|eukprot:CAMPEP_0197526832 /NCGR_PEP_ID=MMETSP1318-20131121/19512_1 /TAXON_ID=552666 /ORGANISM="Partenskyella glossopodia, Strain RCC365" /LENGTH=178 /DNA_ID=CAMNT_0043081191 /DNA_START=38 /DNA_END=574 /DNA_ORIENTATION=-
MLCAAREGWYLRLLRAVRHSRGVSGPASTSCTDVAPIVDSGLSIFAREVFKPWVPGAVNNVILNKDEDSKFKYIEINKSEIRLEFQDTESPVYQYYMSHWTSRDSSLWGEEEVACTSVARAGDDIRELVTDIRNNTFMGAGATVFLCRERVTNYLKKHVRLGSHSHKSAGFVEASSED